MASLGALVSGAVVSAAWGGESVTLPTASAYARLDTEVGLPQLRATTTRPGFEASTNYQTHARIWLQDADADGLSAGDAVTLRGVEYFAWDFIPDATGMTAVDLMRPGYELAKEPDVTLNL